MNKQINLHWIAHPLRVRYQETDQMQVVFHGNYVTWFEIGRTEWIRHYGLSYRKIEESGLLLPIVDLSCRFIAPAKYDDHIIVCTTVTESSKLRMRFASQVRLVDEEQAVTALYDSNQLPGELLVEGSTEHVWVNDAFQPVRLNKSSPELYDLLKKIMEKE